MIVLILVNLTSSRITWEEEPLGKPVGNILAVFTRMARSTHCRWHHTLIGILDCKNGKWDFSRARVKPFCKPHFVDW